MSNAVIGGNIWNPFDTDEEIAAKKEINKKAKTYHIAGVVFAVLAGLSYVTSAYLLFQYGANIEVAKDGNLVASYSPFPVAITWTVALAGIFFISAMAICFRKKGQVMTGLKPVTTIAGTTIITAFLYLDYLLFCLIILRLTILNMV